MKKKPVILIIDDDDLVAEYLKERLILLGYKVSAIALNAEQAFESARQTVPDLALADINLGRGMDGIETAIELRKRYDIPIIFSTGFADHETIERSKTAEPSGYIIKPFDEKDIQSTIEIALYKHKTDQLLKKSKADLVRAQKLARVGNWEWDIPSGKIEWSDELFNIFGIEKQEPSYELVRSLAHPEDRQFWEKTVRDILENDRPFQLEYRAVRPNGEIIWIRNEAEIIRNESGRAIKIFGISQNITDRKQIEADLLKAKTDAERYLQMAGVMFIGLDTRGMVTLVNKKACEVLRCEQNEIIGKDWIENFIPETSKKDVRRVFNQVASGEVDPVRYYENRVLTKTGDEKIVAWYNVVLRDNRGHIIGFLGSGEDITRRKQLEERLRQAGKMESIGTLAGGIAHDFNNILASVIGFTELSLAAIEPGTILEDNLQEVYAAGKRAKELVKQILTFARQTDEELKPIQVSVIAKEVLKLLRASIPTTIEIIPKIESDSLIIGNPTQVHQIFMNLCTNAAQAMEAGGGTLQIGLKDIFLNSHAAAHHPGDYLEITVTDTGFGIDPEHIDSIFEPYFTTKTAGEGTGMGLATVHGIVKSYGGEITAESTPGKGTEIRVYLPVTKKREQSGSVQNEIIPGGNERILFIDDEFPIAKLGKRLLEELGYKVTTRTSSIEALALFRSRPEDFDLVITDMTMPNMTGDELAVDLLKIRPDIPIILCTGYSKKMSWETAGQIGIRAFIYKPLIKKTLADTIRKILDKKPGDKDIPGIIHER